MSFFFLPADGDRNTCYRIAVGKNITLIHIISKLIVSFAIACVSTLIVFPWSGKRISLPSISLQSSITVWYLLGIGSFLPFCFQYFWSIHILDNQQFLIYVLLTLFIHLTAFVLMIRPSWLYVDLKEVVSKYTNSNLANVDKQKSKWIWKT